MRILLPLLFIGFVITACNDDHEISIELTPVLSLDVRDVANLGNASDIEISFIKPADSTLFGEYRIFVVKSTSTIDSTAALTATADLYSKVRADQSSKRLNLSVSVKDSDGDAIVEGIPYKVYVLAKATQETLGGIFSEPSTELTLERKSAVRTLTGIILAGSGGMDVDASGNIYMADFGATLSGPAGTKVYKVTPTGNVSVFASGLQGASGNDFDLMGNLYQSNIGGGRVSKITPQGNVSTFVTNGINGPVGVVYTDNGDFFVCNCGNNTIQKVTATGVSTLYSSSPALNCPNGIDIDQDGILYVANFGDGRVVKIDPSGSSSVLATIPGGNNGHLLIKGEYIYVIARSANRIYRVTFSGQISVFAGSGKRGLDNGSLLQASFSLPNDLAFSPDGTKMYINDVAGNNASKSVISPVVVRVIDLVE